MQILPVTNDNDQIFTTTLDGQVMRIRLIWQDQGESWFFSLLTAQSEIILSNTRIKSNFPVINFKLLDFSGDFIAVPLDINALEPARNAWGTTHTLVYLDGEETTNVLDSLIVESTDTVTETIWDEGLTIWDDGLTTWI